MTFEQCLEQIGGPGLYKNRKSFNAQELRLWSFLENSSHKELLESGEVVRGQFMNKCGENEKDLRTFFS